MPYTSYALNHKRPQGINVLEHTMDPPPDQYDYSFQETKRQYGEGVKPGVQAGDCAEPQNRLKTERHKQEVHQSLELDRGRFVREVASW